MPQWTFSPTKKQAEAIGKIFDKEKLEASKLRARGIDARDPKRTDVIRGIVQAGLDALSPHGKGRS